jgi:hypothetical protein
MGAPGSLRLELELRHGRVAYGNAFAKRLLQVFRIALCNDLAEGEGRLGWGLFPVIPMAWQLEQNFEQGCGPTL